MKKENKIILNELSKLMNDNGYRINGPINQSFLDSIMKITQSESVMPSELEEIKKDIVLFLMSQPDYVDFLERMDGFEFDGLILYSFSVYYEGDESPVNNIFLYNDNFRNNDIYIHPVLSQSIVVGQDSISFFTYNQKEHIYEIRDNVGVENVFGSFDNFNDFLREILDTVK